MLKKRFRRILPLIFTVLLLLQGCTARPLTAPLMLARTRAAVNRERSVSAEVLIEAKAEVSYSGMEFSVPLKIKTSAERPSTPGQCMPPERWGAVYWGFRWICPWSFTPGPAGKRP